MYLQSKLIFQKNNLRNLLFALFAITLILFVFSFLGNSCVIQHVTLINDLKSYENLQDPEFCETLLEKIDSFNEQCEPEIEILDCG